MQWNIGCSGFSNRNWVGYFYPPEISSKEWLEFYAQHFDTLELNSSFYKIPSSTFLKNLHSRTPEAFCIAVKAPKQITHIQKFQDVKELLSDFYFLLEYNLKDKLGPLLFQLPPSFSFSEERLEILIRSLDTNFKNVIEFRHKSWWREDVYKALGDNKICFCGVSYPNLPSEVIINTDFAYYRFHGSPKIYYSMYSNEFLTNVEQTFERQKNLKQVYLLFNNTATRAALENSSFLQQLISL